ncbi:hypothetical protein K470DRAFT_219830, partial [Piedraia hortae CBS 480.64]
EPPNQFVPGDCHPTFLGDSLDSEQYKIVHKLGYGNFSSVWAARDRKYYFSPSEEKYVAVKIRRARVKIGEVGMLRDISDIKTDHPGRRHLHTSIQKSTEPMNASSKTCSELPLNSSREKVSTRNPACQGKLAKEVYRQVLLDVDGLHQLGIAHGNTRLGLDAQTLRKKQFIRKMGTPAIHEVVRLLDQPLDPGVPVYQILFNLTPVPPTPTLPNIKILGDSQAFHHANAPDTLDAGMDTQPAEVVLKQKLDHRVDYWNLGCMLCELMTGQRAFNSLGISNKQLLFSVMDMTRQEMPKRGESAWKSLQEHKVEDDGERKIHRRSGSLFDLVEEFMRHTRSIAMSPQWFIDTPHGNDSHGMTFLYGREDEKRLRGVCIWWNGC